MERQVTGMAAKNFNEMTEEERDDFYRPRKANDRKTMAVLYIYEILKSRTDREHHMSQNDIIKALAENPYELVMERKAVGRIVSLLFNEGMHVYSDRTGAWYDAAMELYEKKEERV